VSHQVPVERQLPRDAIAVTGRDMPTEPLLSFLRKQESSVK
jgi:hypothetical protein